MPSGQGLVPATTIVLGPVREEPVDEHANDGEEEDNEAPGELVQGRAVRLEDLDEDEDVEDQHDEAEEAADAGGVVVEGAAGRLDGRGAGECRKAELEEDVGEGMHGVWTLDSDVVQEVPCLRRVWI